MSDSFDNVQVLKARNITLKLLAKSWKSEKEIESFLKEKNINSTDISEVIEYLENRGYINDEKFGYEWAKYKIENNPVGQRKLYYDLTKKKIDLCIAQNISKKIWAEFNEIEIASSLMEEVRKRFSKLEPSKVKKKIVNFLNSRGFSEDIIEELCSKI